MNVTFPQSKNLLRVSNFFINTTSLATIDAWIDAQLNARPSMRLAFFSSGFTYINAPDYGTLVVMIFQINDEYKNLDSKPQG